MTSSMEPKHEDKSWFFRNSATVCWCSAELVHMCSSVTCFSASRWLECLLSLPLGRPTSLRGRWDDRRRAGHLLSGFVRHTLSSSTFTVGTNTHTSDSLPERCFQKLQRLRDIWGDASASHEQMIFNRSCSRSFTIRTNSRRVHKAIPYGLTHRGICSTAPPTEHHISNTAIFALNILSLLISWMIQNKTVFLKMSSN